MNTPAPHFDNLLVLEAQDLGRRRLQQKGDLYEQGGWWKLRWREDRITKTGAVNYGWSRPVTIGPSKGIGKFTKTQAQRFAWENFLSRLDRNMRTPQSIMTVREFVEMKFVPEHVAMLKPGGRVHYSTQIPIALDGIPDVKKRSRKKGTPEPKRVYGIGAERLRDVSTEDCQRLVSAALQRGYSVGYAIHIRNCISAIFTHAETKDWFNGRNPAKRVRLPENVPAPQQALSFEQLSAVAAALDPVTRAMALCASLTSMNIAEVCGLKWKYVNLSDHWMVVDGESIAPKQIAVRHQWMLGKLGTVKTSGRRRFVVVPEFLAEAFAALRCGGAEDFVFASETGRPVDPKNLLRRRLKPTGKALGISWLGWHTFRRTFATLGDQVGMTSGERQAAMGHASQAMTARYTKTPTENARRAVEEMAQMVREKPN